MVNLPHSCSTCFVLYWIKALKRSSMHHRNPCAPVFHCHLQFNNTCVLASSHPTHVLIFFSLSRPSLWASEALFFFIPPHPPTHRHLLQPRKVDLWLSLLSLLSASRSNPQQQRAPEMSQRLYIQLVRGRERTRRRIDVQSPGLESWNTLWDGWRQTRGMRAKRGGGGTPIVIDYSQFQELNGRLDTGIQTTAKSLFVFSFLFRFSSF